MSDNTENTEKVLAFYFSNTTQTLRYSDERRIELFATHSVRGAVALCGNGLHASLLLKDAMSYAPGPILWHVELSGDKRQGTDKLAARNRKYLRRLDCREMNMELLLEILTNNLQHLVESHGEGISTFCEYLKQGDLKDYQKAYEVFEELLNSRSDDCLIDEIGRLLRELANHAEVKPNVLEGYEGLSIMCYGLSFEQRLLAFARRRGWNV